MLAMWLFSRYLKSLDDHKFITFWEKRVQGKSRYYFLALFIYYIVAVGLITQVALFGSSSVFFDILITMFVMGIYGYYYVINILRVIAVENNRYMQIKMGGYTDNFSKDNVVG